MSISETTIKLRGTVAANGAINAWTLECEVREQMLEYLYNEQKGYLPTERITFKEA